jgi:hypothetical protein
VLTVGPRITYRYKRTHKANTTRTLQEEMPEGFSLLTIDCLAEGTRCAVIGVLMEAASVYGEEVEAKVESYLFQVA